MGLVNNDKFLTTLGDFQAKQGKSSQWISVTIKRGMIDLAMYFVNEKSSFLIQFEY